MGFSKRKKRPELYRDPSVKATEEVKRRLAAESEEPDYSDVVAPNPQPPVEVPPDPPAEVPPDPPAELPADSQGGGTLALPDVVRRRRR